MSKLWKKIGKLLSEIGYPSEAIFYYRDGFAGDSYMEVYVPPNRSFKHPEGFGGCTNNYTDPEKFEKSYVMNLKSACLRLVTEQRKGENTHSSASKVNQE